MEALRKRFEDGRKTQRPHSLEECDPRDGNYAAELPEGRPIQGIMTVVRGLRDEYLILAPRLDEMTRPDVRHDLGTGQNLDVQLFLEAPKLLVGWCQYDATIRSRCLKMETRLPLYLYSFPSYYDLLRAPQIVYGSLLWRAIRPSAY